MRPLRGPIVSAAKPHQFQELFRRACPLESSPERDLIIAVLYVAVGDVLLKAKSPGVATRDALAFFRDGTYRYFCELINLDADWVGDVLRKYAGIECGTDAAGME